MVVLMGVGFIGVDCGWWAVVLNVGLTIGLLLDLRKFGFDWTNSNSSNNQSVVLSAQVIFRTIVIWIG